MQRDDAVKITDLIWSIYDINNSDLLSQREIKRFFVDISLHCQDSTLLNNIEHVHKLIDTNKDQKISK